MGTPLHVLTFLCRETTTDFMLPGYQHDHMMKQPGTY